MFFHKREYAGQQLAARLKNLSLHDPLVLAIPRGGVVTGAALAHDLGAELDVVLARKLRSPGYAQLAIGAVCEDGFIHVENRHADDDYLAEERSRQLGLIARQRELFRSVRPRAAIAGRSVIVTDDGIDSGSAMTAAVQIVQTQKPRELIVAVPLAPPDRVEELRRFCHDVICLHCPEQFWRIGDFYADFGQINDTEAAGLLRANFRRHAVPYQMSIVPSPM
jgi:putative phosphoribosyl transferase